MSKYFGWVIDEEGEAMCIAGTVIVSCAKPKIVRCFNNTHISQSIPKYPNRIVLRMVIDHNDFHFLRNSLFKEILDAEYGLSRSTVIQDEYGNEWLHLAL